MVGHLNKENGVLLTAYYAALHAHNLYLQQAFNFGVPVGILFEVYLVLNPICLFRKAWKSQSSCNMSLLLWLVNGCAFGLFEMMWANGYLAFTLLFLTTCIAVVDESRIKCKGESVER